MRSSVDLPEPERPSSATISPSRSVRLTSSSTTEIGAGVLVIGLLAAPHLEQALLADNGVHARFLDQPSFRCRSE